MSRSREDASERLHPVRAELWCPSGPATPGGSWQVLRVSGREALSAPYRFELELGCEDPSVDAHALLGADAELLLDRNGLVRVVHGLITALELEAAPEGASGLRVQVVLEPALAELAHDLDTRVFTGLSAVEVLERCLGAGLEPFGRRVDSSRLVGDYPRLDYCVQWRESTLAFCRRLMAEAGVRFVFEPGLGGPEQARELLVLVDAVDTHEPAELLHPAPGAGLAFAPPEAEQLDRESVLGLSWVRARGTTEVRVRARDYRRAEASQAMEEASARVDGAQSPERVEHLHEPRRTVIDDPIDDPGAEQFVGAPLDQAAAAAKLRAARHQARALVAEGSSNAIAFTAGCTFELPAAAGAIPGPRPASGPGSEGRTLLLIEVEHALGPAPTDSASESITPALVYSQRFVALASSHGYAPPPPQPKPRVEGVHTGTVVGPEGAAPGSVHTDPLGRIKVLLHATREREAGEHDSCWMRVAQVWAGSGYGALVLPRVGMEVVVAFVDGDPDRPLVTGCVYSGANAPPLELPGERGQSTFKSQGLDANADAFSELRVDDTPGREQLFVRAQRRMDLRVQGTLLVTDTGGREEVVGGRATGPGQDDSPDSNLLVWGDRNVKLSNHHYLTVMRDRHEHVHGDTWFSTTHARMRYGDAEFNAEAIVMEASGRISQRAGAIELTASRELQAKAGQRIVLDSNNRIELRVGDSFLTIAPTGIDIQAPRVRLNSGGNTGSAEEAPQVSEFEIAWPVEAYAAQDGRSGGGGSGRGGRRRPRRHNDSETVEPHRAPPLKPPPPPVPDEGQPPAHGLKLTELRWTEPEVYCSEHTQLWVSTDEGGPQRSARFELGCDDDGQLIEVFGAHVDRAAAQHVAVQVRNVLPRLDAKGVFEGQRDIEARAEGESTITPMRLRFLANLPPVPAPATNVEVRLDNTAVVVGGTIEYTRGWLHGVIRLGATVPPGTGGLIGGRAYGTMDLRYHKLAPGDPRPKAGYYWDGAAWRRVPQAWTNPFGINYYGCAVWSEGEQIRTQFGKLAWPDPLAPWTPAMLDYEYEYIEYATEDIQNYWSERFELKRVTCASEDPACCRHRVVVSVRFEHSSVRRPGGIILAANEGRANSRAWTMDDGPIVAVHEFGHHLGNVDEYPGSPTVNPNVNGDGAVLGIDLASIMGEGEVCRRRHYAGIARGLTALTAEHTDRSFAYAIVDRLIP